MPARITISKWAWSDAPLIELLMADVSLLTLAVDFWNATNSDGSKKYPNFTVSLHSFATKILFNTTGAVPRYVD
jgi:hypothetical protein